MLNISPQNSVNVYDNNSTATYKSIDKVMKRSFGLVFNITIMVLLAIFIGSLFLPWTQTVTGDGYITALNPDERPQTVHSTISGRIEKWFIVEGQEVKMGDTIAFLSEVKADYMDSLLLPRQKLAIDSKESSVKSYQEKMGALQNQNKALVNVQRLKLEQAKNKLAQSKLKVLSDSADWQATRIDEQIAQKQLDRTLALQAQDLKSVLDVENARNKAQAAVAKQISAENKLLSAKNDLLNARIEFESITSDYNDKIAKSQSDYYSTQSDLFSSKADITKMLSQYASYAQRNSFYFIRAPRDGFITRAIKTGIGEIIKEGEAILTIMPKHYQPAVEFYINPMDAPLIHKGKKIRFQFDGIPAFVISGWSAASTGTFGAKIVAVDNFLSNNGKFRALAVPDTTNSKPWPMDLLRIGTGARGLAILEDVTVGYELWRKANGMPPEFYDPDLFDYHEDDIKKKDKQTDKPDKIKFKTPIKSIK